MTAQCIARTFTNPDKCRPAASVCCFAPARLDRTAADRLHRVSPRRGMEALGGRVLEALERTGSSCATTGRRCRLWRKTPRADVLY